MKVTCVLGSPKADGNTAAVLKEILRAFAEQNVEVVKYCLGEETINYCTGCKSCYIDGRCIHNDAVQKIMKDVFASDIVIFASPSYWGDVTGQMKAFIDRCTPYGDTNAARLYQAENIKGIAVAVRAGQNKKENENLVNTFAHFFGHLQIASTANFTVEGVDTAQDLQNKPEVLKMAYEFGKRISLV